jgi:hypothetical protein
MAFAERAYQFGRTLISPKGYAKQLLAFGCFGANFST